jgi:hypothetical protein
LKDPKCKIASSLAWRPFTLKVIEESSDLMKPSSAGWPPPCGWNIVRSKTTANSFSFSVFQKSITFADEAY